MRSRGYARAMRLFFVLGLLSLACANPTALAPASPPDAQPATPPPQAPAATTAAAQATAPAAPVDVPLYYTRPITDADLAGKSLRELQLTRNTIFARAGNPFRKEWLNRYFKAQPWYTPRVRMDESLLTELDRKNGTFVAEYEAKIGREELVRRKEAVLARLAADYHDEDAVEIFLLARALGENAFDYPGADQFLGEDFTEFEVTPLDDPRMLDRQLTVEDLRDLSRRDLRLLRNTVYARHGRTFQSEVLQSWFGDMAWYKPDPAYTDDRLTELDKRNVTIIRSVEDSIGGPMTEDEHRAEWFGAA